MPHVSTPTFSWGKALLHALIVTFLFVAIGQGFSMIEAVPNPGRAGEASVLRLVLVFGIALAASFGLQTGRAWLLFPGVCALLVLLGLQVHAFLTVALDQTTFEPAPLTADERRRPETRIVDDKARICQNALGFYLPYPSDFQPLTQLEDKLNRKLKKENPNIGQWAYANYETGEQLLIITAKDVGKTEANFRAFVRGVRSAAKDDPTVELGEDDLKWSDGQGEYTLSAVVQGTVQVDMRCLSRPGGGLASTLVVCAETATQSEGNEDALEKVRNGLHLLPCV